MKTKLIGIAAAVLCTWSLAADLTEQEQQVLVQVREVYAKQMGRQPTPEEEQRMLDQYRNSVMNASAMAVRMQALASGGGAALLATPPAQAPVAQSNATPAIGEDAMAKRIEALGPGKPNSRIENARDGLKIDGAPYLDPEGKIMAFAFDVLTGDVTYGIQAGEGWIYKYTKAGSDADPVTIATARLQQGSWQVTTATGKQLVGGRVTPLAKGLLVAREGSAFRYEPGKGTKSSAIPDGWIMAQFQRGNVGATKFVLLERIDDSKSGGFGSVMSAVSTLGALVGVSKKEDYALMHLETGKLYPINVQLDGKSSTVLTNCRKRNAVVNECKSSYSFESLYSGRDRNWGHYYWKANWFATPQGPVAVTMENGVTDVYLLDLSSGKKVNAFHRGLGITSVDSEQSPQGKLSLSADWMFETHKIEDAETFLRDNPDVTVADAAK